ncbi:MAG: IS200/IS605 family transposase [Brumimicrobium sp.]
MPNSYTQIYIQAVFAVKYRNAQLDKRWCHELFSNIGKIINDEGCQSIIVNGVEDHIHCFFSLKSDVSVSRVLQRIKSLSSKWINESRLTKTKFHWQSGYAAFSYGQSAFENVVKYIENQEEHHRKLTFQEEYKWFLEKFRIDYDERYVFDELI